MTDKWYLNGDYLLGLMVICVHIPLGMLKKIDFLGFTSFIGMACMSTFVFMVIKKVFFLVIFFNADHWGHTLESNTSHVKSNENVAF